jgi:nucleoside-diphosphate-sugar epimerase
VTGLPGRIESEEQLEELLSRPSAADVAFARDLGSDLLVLGAGGKMGPSLARRVRRARDEARASFRVIAVSRFSEPGLRAGLEGDGVETLALDLLDPREVERLPFARNVLYLVGRKFGSTDRPDLTWAHNAAVPVLVSERLRASRIVVFSTGNVHPPVGGDSAGSTESDAVAPVGEYAWSGLARERLFEHASRRHGTRCLLFRLFYAVDLRYGTLVDIARRIAAGRPVPLAVPRVNALWQGDANSYAFRALGLCASPPRPLVVTGEAMAVRTVALRLGERLGRPPVFEDDEGSQALLGDPRLCRSLLGPPEVDRDRLLEWVADWVAGGGRSLDKPTHFEATDGRF